ncbi:Phage head-tail joining protein [Cohnella sp. OV330]|uniref:head-tail adaptor protein n=1 Tax=Cohnella sp. OV330 TaxID=1855288 RepID=UPI0008F1BB84|nr:head-tail adaptor protein [Cohnella sp. OV330]SFB62606.1 Phage head-tail joining protein [Cohnella sp. OV330]
MRFSDVVELIGLSYVTTGDTDTIVEQSPRETFAERRAVRQSEYYQAIGNALRPTATFVVWAAEYQGESRLRHNGTYYEVIRTFETKDRTMELVCGPVSDVQTNLSQMRSVVEIWHNAITENSMSEKTVAPERLCTVPAQIAYKGGGASESDGITETTNDLTVTIRYRAGLTPAMFLMIGGVRHDIRYMEDPFDRHETLILSVEKVTP